MPRDTDDSNDDGSADDQIRQEKDGLNQDYLLDNEEDADDLDAVVNFATKPNADSTNHFQSAQEDEAMEPQNANPRRRPSGAATVIKADDVGPIGPTPLPRELPPPLPFAPRPVPVSSQPDPASSARPVPSVNPPAVTPPAVTPPAVNQPAVTSPAAAAQTAAAKPAAPIQAPVVTPPKIAFTIPNGSEGKPFAATIRPTLPAALGTVTSLESLNFQFPGIEQYGIAATLDDHQIILRGQPTVSGEIKIQYQYTLPRDAVQGRPELTHTGQANWFVNPDPRSLWKNLTPDTSLPYPKPPTDRDRVVGPATLIAASVRGRSHAHEGTFRDDDFTLQYNKPTGWYLLTVCDGAGSAKFSRRGSQLACKTVTEELLPHYAAALASPEFESAVHDFYRDPESAQRQVIRSTLYTVMGGVAMKAFKAIQTEAKQVGTGEVNQFATTIIFTIAKNYGWGWFVGAFCIGDGGAAIYSKQGRVKVLNKPDGGEFAGQTRFLTMPDIWSSGQKVLDRIQFEVTDDLAAIFAMTDGVSDPKFETDNRFFDTQCWHDFWQDLEREVELTKTNSAADQQLLKWLDFWSPGNHDDRTLAILLP